jgi:hypothetical protein
MNYQERKLGHSSAVSTVVLMELIQHLEDGDPFQDECYKALYLAYIHTRTFKDGHATGSYIPPMNIILAQAFFDANSKYHELYNTVIGLFLELVKAGDINECQKHQADIKTVRAQILFEKAAFKSNVEQLIASVNNGVIDWTYMANNKQERRKFFDGIHNGRFEYLLAISLMQRAHQIMDVEEFIEDVEGRFEAFRANYQAAIIMNINLLEAVGQGVKSLQEINDPKWNTLNDVQIMFGFLYQKHKDEIKKLVTEEKKIHEAATKAGIGASVIKLQQYLEMVEVKLD